ncbi:hypothetical protein NY78_3017 [Desulfovibrio sp. TomC]|nr:hypothetical protein NY78_3017 [Desulfovibrio sp. TomC]
MQVGEKRQGVLWSKSVGYAATEGIRAGTTTSCIPGIAPCRSKGQGLEGGLHRALAFG